MTEYNGEDIIALLSINGLVNVKFIHDVGRCSTVYSVDDIATIISYRPVELDVIEFTTTTKSSDFPIPIYIGREDVCPFIVLPMALD